MAGTSVEELHEPHTTPLLLVDVLHKAPRLFELLPQSSCQALSVTCSYFHKLIRARIRCIRIRNSDELSGIVPEDWPSLVAVLLSVNGAIHSYLDSERHLQGKWCLDVQVCFLIDCDRRAIINHSGSSWPHLEFVVLISLEGSFQQKEDFELTTAQCEILSQCINKNKRHITQISVGDQQQHIYQHQTVYKYRPQTAPSAQCLPSNLWSCFSSQDWPHHLLLDLRNQDCGLACAWGFVRCSLPANGIVWSGVKLSLVLCVVLVQACLPDLRNLCLANNYLSLWDITGLSSSSWSQGLTNLDLGGNALGEEGARALSSGTWEALEYLTLNDCGISSHAAVTCLAQVHFPKMVFLDLTGNQFTSGAVRCLSGAQWPVLESVTVGLLDLPGYDCEFLGIHSCHFRNVTAEDVSGGLFWEKPQQDRSVLPSVDNIIVLLYIYNAWFQ